MKIEVDDFNELHVTAADIMLHAEESFVKSNKKAARRCALDVLSLPGCSAYYPAARLMLERCGKKAANSATVRVRRATQAANT